MTTTTMKKTAAALGWCALVNCGILAAWLLAFVFARGLFHRMHEEILGMSVSQERMEAIHFTLMGGMEILVIVFNLTPFLVLLALSRREK